LELGSAHRLQTLVKGGVAKMKATNGFTAGNSPNPGLTKRLQSNKKRLLQDETWRLFDWGTLEVLGDYALDMEFLDAEIKYLKNLKDAEGRPFCRSMGREKMFSTSSTTSSNQKKLRSFGTSIASTGCGKCNLVMRRHNSVSCVTSPHKT
jgi:hypothetical protein